MFRVWLAILFGCALLPVTGAERLLEFSRMKVNEPPPGFRNTMLGEGRAGDWRIIETEVPPVIPSISAKAETPRQNVLAQMSRDPVDNRYPLLILDDEEYGDFTVTTRFKLQAGVVEQMAGLAFRIQNESNYFYVRASGLYNSLKFIPVVNGQLGAPVGVDIPIEKGVFHELKIQCNGNEIRCWLDGKEPIPAMNNATFSSGKIGFWTKSDSVSYFTDTLITYSPREPLSTVLLRDVKEKYSRILGVRIIVKKPAGPEIIASYKADEIGKPANDVEKDILDTGKKYVGKNKEEGYAIATLPLHDKNGEVIAAVRFEMEPFPGQTEKSVLSRTMPIIRDMELRIAANKDLKGLQ